jgi:hypothetical protein
VASPVYLDFVEAARCSALAFSPCGKKLAAGFWDGRVNVYCVPAGTKSVTRPAAPSLVRECAPAGGLEAPGTTMGALLSWAPNGAALL